MNEEETKIELDCTLTVSEIRRILYLLNQDRIRLRGSMFVAQERIERGDGRGRQREHAVKTLAEGPKHEAVLLSAMDELKVVLDDARKAKLIQ